MSIATNTRNMLPVHILIMATFIVGFHFIPPDGDVTEGGMSLIGLFIAMLYGWTFCDMLWVSLLGIVCLPFTGLVTLPDFLASSFGSETLVFILFIFFFAGVINEVGLVDYIANKIISFKVLNGRPWLFSTFLILGAFISAAFVNAFVAIIVFWDIIFIVSERFGFNKKDKYPTLMILGVAIATSVGGAVMPYHPVPVVVLNTYSQTTGMSMDIAKYILFALPVTTLVVLVYMAACRFIFRPDLRELVHISVDFADPEKAHLNKQQKVALGFLCVFIFMIIAPSILPADFLLTRIIDTLGLAGTVFVMLIAMCWVKFNGQPMADFKKLKSHVNYDIWVMMCFVIPFASIFTGEKTGIKESIIAAMQPILAGKSEMLFIVIVISIATILTNFANNMVVGAVFTTLIVTIGGGMGMSEAPVVAILTVASCLSFATPAACPNMAMTFALKDWVKPTDIYKYATVTVILCLVFTLIIGQIWANLIY